MKNNDNQEDKTYQSLKHTAYQPSAYPQKDDTPADKSTGSRPTAKKILLRSFVAILMLIFLLFGTFIIWNIRNFSDASESLFGESNVLKAIPVQQLNTDSSGKTNILVVGSATDRTNHGGADLTDTLLIVSLDDNGEGYMLSIPRDLYIAIPGYRTAKINESYSFGERSNFSDPEFGNGGIGILSKMIDENFNIDIHYYATVNFGAVEEIVNVLGGINVVIDSPDERGIYDPNFQPDEGGALRLENGPQVIDGQTALRLTRARGSAGGYGFPQSDFNRTKNQQAVIVGIIKALTPRSVLDPRTNKQLFDTIAQNVETNLEINELIPMGKLLFSTDVNSIDSHTLRDLNGKAYVSSFTTPDGLSALIPSAGINDYTEIQAAIARIHN